MTSQTVFSRALVAWRGIKSCLLILVILFSPSGVAAEEGAVNIRDGIPFVDVQTDSGPFRIERERDNYNEIFGD